MYNLYSEFDLKKHMETYINYLEVIMLPSGKILYAVPSHQELLINIAMKKYNKTRKEIEDMCPESMYYDYLTWLLDITGCIAIWSHTYTGKPNRIQKQVLNQLISKGLTK